MPVRMRVLGPRAGWAAMLSLAGLLAAGNAQSQPADEPALYGSGQGGVARLRSDPTVLPDHAARCANCHEPSRQVGSNANAALAPRLDARLKQALQRRGGPPTAFDEATFCRLLRTGVDPAHVLVRKAMPVYELDDAACAAMWLWVSARAPQPEPVP